MNKWNRIFLIFTLSQVIQPLYAQQKKEFDFDVNYEESKVPAYQLPVLLQNSAGEEITTIEQWENNRRPEIISLFANLIYGIVPVPSDKIKVEYFTIEEDMNYLDGSATRRNIRIELMNANGTIDLEILCIIPNSGIKPYPAFLMISFDAIDSPKLRLAKDNNEKLGNGCPIQQLIDSGYAFISAYHQDLVKHNDVEFASGIHQLYYKEHQSFPKSHEWGVLAACGFGASLTLDYLETQGEVDPSKVILMGHSKLGKAALWAAARDQRFAIAISANSGCAGAALWRRKFGETLQKMCTRFPYWLCYNAQKFIGSEEDLPIDQHMLIALMAPRPVYVASAKKDNWADPTGEFLSAYHASVVYELYGKKGLNEINAPERNKAYYKREVGYHLRDGGHYIADYDWHRFIDFANYHLK